MVKCVAVAADAHGVSFVGVFFRNRHRDGLARDGIKAGAVPARDTRRDGNLSICARGVLRCFAGEFDMRGVCFDAFRVHEAQHARLHPETQTRGGMLGIIEGCFRSRDGRIGAGIAQRRSDGVFQIVAIRWLSGHGDLNGVHALLHLLWRERGTAFALLFDRGDGVGCIHHRGKLHAGFKRTHLVKSTHVRIRHACGHEGLIHAVRRGEVLAATRLAVSPARHAADEATAALDVLDQGRALFCADHALRVDDDDIKIREVLFFHLVEFFGLESAL